MKILVCGFYNHKNLGDDFYQLCFREILCGNQIEFSELSILNTLDLSSYDALVIGGGDLMNDFYGIKYEEVLKNYNGYKIAVSVGFSFEECTKREYISYFDDIILRSKKDIPAVTKILGSVNTHFMPDLVFDLPLRKFEKNTDGKNIGLFLVGYLVDSPSFMFPLMMFVNFCITNGYRVFLIPMHSESDNPSNDLRINEIIFKTFSHTGMVVNLPEQNIEIFEDVFSKIDYGFCIRFHGHIFCTKYGIPFLSVPITRKAEIYISEIPENTRYDVSVNFDVNYNVISFDVEDAKRKFFQLRDNYSSIRDSLCFYSEHCFSKGEKISQLISNRQKRKVSPQELILLNPEDVYQKYLRIFSQKGINIFTDKLSDMPELIDQTWINNIADNICYDLTKDPANDYNYGTRINITENISKLRDMIYYIYQVNLEKIDYPKLNMNYIKQDSFRGLHRAGWQYAIDSLYCFSGDHGVLLDTYLDRTFGWASNVLSASGIIPYTNRWIGFIHHTFDTQFSNNNCEKLFESSDFIRSLPLCVGIFCLTRYLSDLVRQRLNKIGFGHIPVESLHHPTIFTNMNFSMPLEDKISVVNVGSWYRNPVTIHIVANLFVERNCSNFVFSSLKGKRMNSNFCPDSFKVTQNDGVYSAEENIWTKYFIRYVQSQSDDYSKQFYLFLQNEFQKLQDEIEITKDMLDDFLKNVSIIEELKNGEYDLLLSKSVVFLDLVDASTANTILECIVRSTPILLNRIPPTIELMGEDYPLFYNSVEEAVSILTIENVAKAFEYISKMDKEIYRIDSFVEQFSSSQIYRSIS